MPKGEKDILGVNAQMTKRVLLGVGTCLLVRERPTH